MNFILIIIWIVIFYLIEQKFGQKCPNIIQLKRLRSILIGGAADFPEFVAELKQLEAPLINTIKDLRSALPQNLVVKEACITVS